MCSVYFYYLVNLQSWIFAMRYLESAVNCTLNREQPLLSNIKIQVIRWSVLGGYTIGIVVLGLLLMLEFPGYVQDDSMKNYDNWLYTQYKYIRMISKALWLSLIVLSTCVSVYAIAKQF